MSRPQAILLLGPTGSGKTPLGEMLQARGLGTGQCMHFDFGGRLRRIAAGLLNVDELTGDDRALISGVLDRGALLEDEHFGVAEKILRAFIAEQNIGPADESWHGRPAHATIILNGLPRHVGQADDVDRIVTVRLVIELSCSAQTVSRRLADDAGGDRADRIDDAPARVRKKLELYTRRTEGLLDHYRSLGAAVISLTVGPDTTAEDTWRELARTEIGSGESKDA